MSIVLSAYFCLCENKDADQLRSNSEADQRLCFRYTDSKFLFFLNQKFQASSTLLKLHRLVCVRPGQKPLRLVISRRSSYEIKGSYSYEPPHGKTNNLHMRKQRCRPAPLFSLHRLYTSSS